jgi:GNAT superfamily N-acetyltransferase
LKTIPGLEIRPATQVPQELLAEFYRRIDPPMAHYRSRNWRWLCRAGETACVSPPLLALLDGSIVGHAGLIPVTVQLRGRQRSAIWFVDFWILPQHQHKGIGIALTRAWMALCPLQITFCNEKSLGVFLKLGWKVRRDTRILRLLLRPERQQRLQGRGVREAAWLAGFASRALARVLTRKAGLPAVSYLTDGEVADLCAPPAGGCCAPRSRDFLRWRLADSPFKSRYLLFRRPGAPCAAGRVIQRDGNRRLCVLAIGGAPDNAPGVYRAMAGIVRWAAQADIDEVMYITSDPAAASALRLLLPVGSRALFAYHAENPDDELSLAQDRHFWEALDSDFDLLHLTPAE